MAPICMAGVAIGFYALPAAALGPALCKVQGVVAQAATDFSMSALVPTTTLMPLTAGVLASALAQKSEGLGVRRLALAASTLYPVGVFVLPGIAVQLNSFPAFALSYVAVGGVGFFCAYPQQTPHGLRWFPDRPGVAVSLFNVSFGLGLVVGVPVVQKIVSAFKVAPSRLGSLEEVLMAESGPNGERMALVGGQATEVVLATQRDLDMSGFSHLSEGVYLLDGSNGAAETMICVGGLAGVCLQLAMWSYRLPAKGLVPGAPPAAADAAEAPAASTYPPASKPPAGCMTLEEAMRTPHLYLLALSTVASSPSPLALTLGPHP